ncbi:MAG: hypothetical protein NZ960_04225 [Candidatus Kapabacteria bacterium]|nr:hypothetical protein [Candidatus Kapabacteria bacterium]MDW8012140.1 hypothetical protein [Bacteroidota bacterium]
MDELERQAWGLSLLGVLLGLLLAAVVYWLTGVVLLVLVFAPPLVMYLLRRWHRRRDVTGNGYPFQPW